MFAPRTLIASSSFTSTLRLLCRGTFVVATVCLVFSYIFFTRAVFCWSSAAFSISSSSLFVISDLGFLLLFMISRVSSKDNLLLLFGRKIFSIASQAEAPVPLIIADLLSCIVAVCLIFLSFSISLSSLFVISDSGFLLLFVISRVSPKENLLLLFGQKLFSSASPVEAPVPLLITDLLSCSRAFGIPFLFTLLLHFFCPLFLFF